MLFGLQVELDADKYIFLYRAGCDDDIWINTMMYVTRVPISWNKNKIMGQFVQSITLFIPMDFFKIKDNLHVL